ncbi:MAG: nitrilase [Chloroflexi bacterium]|nr:nitrilase [Chloroflexota bacterium]
MLDTRVAMVQMRCEVGNADRNIAAISEFVDEARRQDVDIVCFPELGVSGYNAGDTSAPVPEPIPGPSSRKLEAIAVEKKQTFLAGILERDAGGIVYNTQIAFGPSGTVGMYRKTHVPTAEIGTWSQGSDLPVFEHPKARYGLEICYDSHFPEVSTALANRGAEIIFLPHASGGETPEEKYERWLRYVPARAYDNGVFVGICNQVGNNGAGREFAGVTFICDPRGRVIARAESGDRDEMVVADLKAEDLAEARSEPETFFRHFRRPEVYREWGL